MQRWRPWFQSILLLVASIVVIGTEMSAVAVDGELVGSDDLSFCTGDCDANNVVSMSDLITLINGVLVDEVPATCPVVKDANMDAGVENVVQAVNFAHGGCPAAGTPTETPTPTQTPTLTPTFDLSAPLGKRRFNVNPNNGGFFAAVGGTTLRLGGFRGQSNGVIEQAYFEFDAGVPDPNTKIARINVTKSSEYLVADASNLAGVVFCLKLQTPITNAGAIDCDGGSDFSIGLRADHHLGELGVDDFTADQCAEMGGVIEGGNQLCKTGNELGDCRSDSDCDTAPGAGDGSCGLAPSQCVEPSRGAVCDNDSDCDSTPTAMDGHCGPALPHIGVCNGSFQPVVGSGNSGAGSVSFAPIPGFLTGLPATLSIESSLPCGDEGGSQLSFALTSTSAKATIEDVNDMVGQTLDFSLSQATGATPKLYELQNFSCQNWTSTTGPGCMGLVAPAFHQLMGNDIVTAFKLCGN